MVNRRDDTLDAVFSALSHPARRAMLERLARGSAAVGELAGPHDMSAPAISRHVRVLEASGLVQRTRDGRVHRMDLAGGALGDALAWLHQHHRFWNARLDRLAALLETPPEQEDAPCPPPAPDTRSGSNARSPRRRNASTRRGRTRTR